MTATILSAVQSLCSNMVAPPLDATSFQAGDIVISKHGNRYKLVKARGVKDVFKRNSSDFFQLQSLTNLQVGHTKWTARQLQVAGVKKA